VTHSSFNCILVKIQWKGKKGMASNEKFLLLRKILQALGLSKDAVDDIVDRITDLLSIRITKRIKRKNILIY